MTVSSTFKAALFGQQTGEALLVLLAIDHDDMASTLYVVNNTENITSNAQEYIAFPFETKLPDFSQGIPKAQLTISNVDRQIVQTIRSITSKPTVTLSVVLSSTPDTIEYGPLDFEMDNVQWNVFVVTGTLSFENIHDEPYGGDRFTPNMFPGLFT
jgi:hypothetical protein